jgi:hypothetical protein
MTIRFNMTSAALLTVLCLGLAIGCGRTAPSKSTTKKDAAQAKTADTHDHGDGSGAHSHGADPHDVVITEADVKKPADYKDAVARIKEYRKDIEVNAGGDVPGKAHRPLDELDIVLKWLPGIARDSNVPKNQWETINTSGQKLRELFEKVHQNIDNKKNPDFPGVAKEVDETIGRLEAAAGATGAESKP